MNGHEAILLCVLILSSGRTDDLRENKGSCIDRNVLAAGDYIRSLVTQLIPGDFRPWRYQPPNLTFAMKIDTHKTLFKMDLLYFTPSEVSVQIKNRYVVVEARQEFASVGSLGQHLLKQYRLPEDVDTSDVTAEMSTDGILSVKAPKMRQHQNRAVPIVVTGPQREPLSYDEHDSKCDQI